MASNTTVDTAEGTVEGHMLWTLTLMLVRELSVFSVEVEVSSIISVSLQTMAQFLGHTVGMVVAGFPLTTVSFVGFSDDLVVGLIASGSTVQDFEAKMDSDIVVVLYIGLALIYYYMQLNQLTMS